MYKKRALVLGGYLSLLALAACGPKVIDDADIVSVDYKYTFSDGTVIEEGTKDFTVGNAGELTWIEDIVRGAKVDAEFEGKINGGEVYQSEIDSKKVQSYGKIALTEAMGVKNPVIGAEVEGISLGNGIITDIQKDTDGNDIYLVNFNDPKTYLELSYSIKVTNIEKN